MRRGMTGFKGKGIHRRGAEDAETRRENLWIFFFSPLALRSLRLCGEGFWQVKA